MTNTSMSFEEDCIDRLARIETNLQAAIASDKDMEDRVRSLEKRQWHFLGALAIFGAMLAKFSHYIHLQ